MLPAAMLLVGNKLDLDEFEEREVSTQTGQDFAKVGLMVTAELIYCVCVCVCVPHSYMGLSSSKQVQRLVRMWATPL